MNEPSTADAMVEPVEGPTRGAWRARRLEIEARNIRSTPIGISTRRSWIRTFRVADILYVLLRICGLYRRGVRNALALQLRELDLGFRELPREFDGFRILQITDMHVDMLPEVMDRIYDRIAPLNYDLCVLTGDYRKQVSGPFRQILPSMAELVSKLSTQDGIYAVLGNHDCAEMSDAFEELGITMLNNETQPIRRGRSQIHLTGTDDVHCYYTEAAKAALEASPHGFKIALIHSAELADAAADCGYDLYLAGHTHGGQICLPGEHPVITQMIRFREYASGLWKRGDMVGYTSTGAGTSALPVRFNCRGEVALITLRRR